MKDFMFLFRGPADLKLSPEESQIQLKKWFDWIGKLTADQRFAGGGPMGLEAKTIKGPKILVTDGPFAEGKELVGGYLLIRAESLEEAKEMSFGYPDFDKNCSVEIREIVQIPSH